MKRILPFVFVMLILLSVSGFASETESFTGSEYSDEIIDGLIADIDKEIEILEKKKETLLAMKTTDTSSTDWEVKYFVDEFDRPTEDPYLQLSFEGSFSNSAVDGARLTGCIIVDDEFMGIYLDEYGSNPVKNYFSDEKTFYMTVLEENENKYRLRWRFLPGSNRLLAYADARGEKVDNNGNFENGTYQTFISTLRSNNQLTFKLSNNMNKTDSYLVEMDNVSGFADLFDATFAQDVTEDMTE